MKVSIFPFNTTEATDKIFTALSVCRNENPEQLNFDMAKKSEIIKYVLDSGHESIAEHVIFTFLIKGVSRSLTHQLIRHRLATYTQLSQRYTTIEDREDFLIPKTIKDNEKALKIYNKTLDIVFENYKHLISIGIKPEDARMILPNCTSTSLVMTVNCRSLKNFFGLRLCRRAQSEIRELASNMASICREKLPIVFTNCKWAEPKCIQNGRCTEKNSCGYFQNKDWR